MSQVPSVSAGTPVETQNNRPLILLLEDEQSCADALIQLLEHYQFEVRLAKTILEAMPLLPLGPKFAILDLGLPDGGGERILELIRRRKLATKVSILTGSRDRDRLKDAARLKPDLMLTKPVDFFRLLEFLRAA